MTIDASALPDGITIDANQLSRVFNVSGGTTETPVQLIGLTITGGKNYQLHGAGVYSVGKTVLQNCVITNNFADGDATYVNTYGNGGGIYNQGELTLTNCVVSDNTASQGGGICSVGGDGATSVTMTNCSVSDNTASNAGGIYISHNALSLTKCVVSGNSATGFYGGVFVNGWATVIGCEITNNAAAKYGGGVYAFSGNVYLANCLLSGNSCESYGGAIGNLQGRMQITNCTIAGNSAGYGGGICNSNSNSYTIVTNSVVASNTATVSGADIYKKDAPITQAYVKGSNNVSTFTQWQSDEEFTSTNNLWFDASTPLFTAPANGDYTLARNSPAIDQGNNAYAVYADGSAIEFDLAGKSRIVNNFVDIGAYEWRLEPETPSLVVTTNLDVFDPFDGVVSLREAITYAGTTLGDGSTLGTTVTFDASLTGKTIVLYGMQLDISAEITIDASALPDGITIDADQKSRVFTVLAGTEANPVQLKNLTITGGKSSSGGGIYNSGYLTPTNCTVTQNTASENGGGISNSGTIILTNCSVTQNTASEDGDELFDLRKFRGLRRRNL